MIDWESKTASKVVPPTETAIIMEIPSAIPKEDGSPPVAEQHVALKEVLLATPKPSGGTKSGNDTPFMEKSKHASMVLFVRFQLI